MSLFELMNLGLLLIHGLVSVALLGATSHQCTAVLRKAEPKGSEAFINRYAAVNPMAFPWAVALLYVTSIGLGAVLYPEYRLEARFSLEEMRLLPVVGLFELKEHFAAIGLGLLPLYLSQWKLSKPIDAPRASTLTLGFIVWFSFIVGHVVNNFRGV